MQNMASDTYLIRGGRKDPRHAVTAQSATGVTERPPCFPPTIHGRAERKLFGLTEWSQ